jgi:hypothetical protein
VLTTSRAVFGDGKKSTNAPPLNLAEARLWMLGQASDGAKCPCCGRTAKIYRRHLNKGMAISLVRMFKAAPIGEYVHVPTVCSGGTREEAKLRFWGLAEEATELRDDGGRAGWWKVTQDGARFVRLRLTVPSHVLLYRNRFRGFDGPQVDIQDCLGKSFDLAELMA